MNLIKCATVYRADLPEAAALAEHLAEVPFTPVLESHISSSGFIQNPATEQLVTEFPGGFSFRLRRDIKPISAKAVDLALADQISAKAKELDRDLTKEEVDQLKTTIFDEAIKSTLPERTELNAFYHIDSRTLILPTSNKHLANALLIKLLDAEESVETRARHVSEVKGGLAARLRDHFEDEDKKSFHGFAIGDSVVMKGDKGRASFDLDNLDNAKQGVLEALASNMQVERLELCHADAVNFKLTKDFQLRSITYLASDQDEEQDFDTYGELWGHTASVQLLLLSATVQALCDLFGYQEKPLDDGEKEKTGSQQDLPLEDDSLYDAAVEFVRESGRASISAVQRKLKIGYNRAARMIETMEQRGVVTAMNSNGSREVIRHG